VSKTVECDCMVCGKPLENYDPKMCCNGHDCGCMGRPTQPPICSGECWDALMTRNGNGKSNDDQG
jgi:hypothetical protein